MINEVKEQVINLAKSLCEERGCTLILLKIGGSVAYGINRDESDLDIRGVYIENINSVLGLNAKKREENIEYHKSEEEDKHKDGVDLVLYPLQKFCNLACATNPNIIELLADNPDLILYINDYGTELINNRKLFLSKECIKSYGGYLIQEKYQVGGHLAEWQRKKLDKYIAHIFRLYESAIYLLETGDIMCRLPEDLAAKIIEIREGSLSYKDWDSRSLDVKKFEELFDQYSDRFHKAQDKSTLPECPDRNSVNKLLVKIYKDWLKNY